MRPASKRHGGGRLPLASLLRAIRRGGSLEVPHLSSEVTSRVLHRVLLREGPALCGRQGFPEAVSQFALSGRSPASVVVAIAPQTAGKPACRSAPAPLREGSACRANEVSCSPTLRIHGCGEPLLPLSDGERRGVPGRPDLPVAPLRPRQRASWLSAVEVASSEATAACALEELEDAFFATSARGPRQARVQTLIRLANAFKVPLLPITSGKLKLVSAAFKKGRYRSAALYLNRWK